MTVVPGRYRSEPINGFGCYWARLSGVSGEFADILANANVAEGSAIVQIKPSDQAIRLRLWQLDPRRMTAEVVLIPLSK